MPSEHLNRHIALAAGVSRRAADAMIRSGRVSVSGVPVLDPGALFDPSREEARIDGRSLVPLREERIYIMLHKPDNVVTTMADKEGRKTVAQLVGDLATRVFPVGRLDYHTTGLLLLTNDGEMAYRITHPRFRIEKTYIAKVQGTPDKAGLRNLRDGIVIDGEMTNPAWVKIHAQREGKTWVEIRIAEGRYHQVRKMFDFIGTRVTKLRRTAIGPLQLADVEPGEWRYLTGQEVRELSAYIEKRAAEAALTRPVVRRPHPKRIETPEERLRRKLKAERLKEAAMEARSEGQASRPPASAPARPGVSAPKAGIERKGPRQPKPEWKHSPRPPASPRPGGPGRGAPGRGTQPGRSPKKGPGFKKGGASRRPGRS